MYNPGRTTPAPFDASENTPLTQRGFVMCGFGRLLTFSDPASVALYGISRGAFVSEQERLDEEFARWSNWLSDPIYEDTIDLMAARQLFSEYGEVVEHAPDDVRQLTGPLQTWVSGNYIAKLASGIRRQSEVSPSVVSIATLLDRIARNPRALSKERSMGTAGTDGALLLGEEENYFNQFAISTLEYIDPTVPSGDLHRLQSVAGPIRKWVNKGLAH